ncbi:MAG: PAS domain-containing protein [Desulfobacteraceae bacterium]|nr:MAG: PAS domain-containing protein [Desulfobacteraceae bacterium]
MNLDSLFYNLLTSGIRLSDPETLRKFKTANSFHLIFIMVAPFLGLLYFYMGALPLFYVSLGAGLLMIASFILLRATKNLPVGSHFGILIAWVSLLFISWHTGAVSYQGVLGPTFTLNAGLILLALYLLGYPGGTVWTMVVFLETGLIVYLYRSGFQFPDLIPPEIATVYSLGTYLVALLSILLFAFLFEKEKGEVLLRDREKSEALNESKRYIEDILRNSPVPTFILDKNHRVVHWNAACRELTKVPAEQILGKKVWEGFFVDDRGSVADIILEDPLQLERDYGESILSASENGWFELKLSLPMLRDSPAAVITASPILDKAGIKRGAIQTIQVEQGNGKSVESPGEGSEWVGVEMGRIPIFKVDAQERITDWNEACVRDYEYPSSEMVGKSILELVSKNYRPLFKETIAAVLEGKSIKGRPFKYYTREGKPVYVLAEAFPAMISPGNGRECVVINTDITQLRLRMKKLELYAAENKEKLKSLTEEYDLVKKNIASFIRKKDD